MLDDLFRQMASQPDRIAFTDESGPITNRRLLEKIITVSTSLEPDTRNIGLTGPNNIDWVAIFLGSLMAGRTVTPIPGFFSESQRDHILRDAAIDTILSSGKEIRSVPLKDERKGDMIDIPAADSEWQLVIYTSGTTGKPKGVRLGQRQVGASMAALAATVRPRADDRYISLLPFSLLLEQIAGILVPLMTGIQCVIATRASTSALTGDILPLLDAVDRSAPSMTVLVPALLEGWVAAQEDRGARLPENLRFVAVGGAPIPPGLIDRARRAGIPAYSGYGLSECCSVVAVNVPGADRSGSVGRCLPGRVVTIDDGEIIVTGPAVMTGYLGGTTQGSSWRTGDIGHLDQDGFLYVHGRKDNMLVTTRGRNISPEWIESMLTGDPRVARCVLTGHGLASPKAVIVPAADMPLFEAGDEAGIRQWIAEQCREAPEYAHPDSIVVVTEAAFREARCLTPQGRIDRQQVQARFGVSPGRRQSDVQTKGLSL